MPTVHLLIKGKVQGVFYRATTKDVADEYGITGWIRNTKEGDVEAEASGTDDQLQRFIEWCRLGPRRAVVIDVVVTEKPYKDFTEFKIIR